MPSLILWSGRALEIDYSLGPKDTWPLVRSAFRAMRLSTSLGFVLIGLAALFVLVQIAHYAILTILALEHGGLVSLWIQFLSIYLFVVLISIARPFLIATFTWVAFRDASATVSPNGLTFQGKPGPTFVPWGRVRAISEDNHYLYFWLRNVQVYLIPKRAFRDQGEVEAFRDEASRYLSAESGSSLAGDPGAWPPAPKPGA